MRTVDEKYAYFQPGELFYLLQGKNGRPLSVQIQSGDSESDQTGDPTSKIKAEQKTANHLDADKPKRPINEKIDKLIKWSNQIAKSSGLDLTITRNETRELHYPGYRGPNNTPQDEPKDEPKDDISRNIPAEQASPLSHLPYKSPVIAPPGAFSLIPANVGQNSVPWKDNPDSFVEQSKLAHVIGLLDDSRETFPDDDIEIAVVSPNWLSSPTSEWGGGGGPGSRPVPYNGKSDSAPYEFHFPPEVNSLFHLELEKRGEGVRVAILDTMPSIHNLVWAYEKYHKVNPEKQQEHHPLIESLLRPGGSLHTHPASSADLFRMRAVHLRDHNYNMTDHGLFVAGIVHTIAPAAEIHLYEVLNSEGVGDLVTIFNALLNIIIDQVREYEKTGKMPQLVVNCSLVLNIPLDGNPGSPKSATLIPSKNPRAIVGHRLTDLDKPFVSKIAADNALLGKGLIKKDETWIERSSSAIHGLCDDLFLSGSRVVAAAGNDWVKTEDPGRPRARYLASFKSVQGVGALPKNQDPAIFARTSQYETSSYSDLSDEPSSVGIVTLGGEPGEGNGVLGIYIGEFPPFEKLSLYECFKMCLVEFLCGKYCGPKNKSDWAWWAGTSFATPIMTGAIAAVFNGPGTPVSTTEAIEKIYQSGAVQENKTSYSEDVFVVTQQ